MVCLAETTTVQKFINQLKDNNCVCSIDLEAGTALAKDGDIIVYQAVQKSKLGDWIVRCQDSERIHWKE